MSHASVNPKLSQPLQSNLHALADVAASLPAATARAWGYLVPVPVPVQKKNAYTDEETASSAVVVNSTVSDIESLQSTEFSKKRAAAGIAKSSASPDGRLHAQPRRESTRNKETASSAAHSKPSDSSDTESQDSSEFSKKRTAAGISKPSASADGRLHAQPRRESTRNKETASSAAHSKPSDTESEDSIELAEQPAALIAIEKPYWIKTPAGKILLQSSKKESLKHRW